MTEVKVKVKYAEQSKGVTAETAVEIVEDTTTEGLQELTEKVKKEADLLFEAAFRKSKAWSLQK